MRAGRRLLPILALLQTACVTVTTLDGRELSMRSEEFSAYLEGVFREQNRVATELTLALETPGLSDAERGRLEGADEAVFAACAELNRVAARRRDGEGVGWRLGSRAAREAPGCEAAVRDARDVL